MPADFHFLRPEWLLALLPAAVLALALWRRLGTGRSDWARVIDPHLLAHLAAPGGRSLLRWPAIVLLAGWAAAILAMAGPAWDPVPQPVADRPDPVAVVLSLSASMAATDESPTRLDAARYKVADVLARRRGGEVALVVYADVPFVASPLTVDSRVLAQMLPEAGADPIRAPASRPDLAVEKAAELLRGGGAAHGRILLFTDGPGDMPEATRKAAAAAADAGFEVSIAGVGKGKGAGGAAPIDAAALAAIAAAGGGIFTPLTADNSDLDALLARAGGSEAAGVGGMQQFSPDAWADMGPFLLVLAVLLAPLAFRRGWIIVLLLVAAPALLAPPRAVAASLPVTSWDDLWARPDQQGATAFARSDFPVAAQRFEDPAWRAAALYKAGDYEAAAAAYAALPGADYNRGNALARAGRLEEAVAAYDAALAAAPDHADARANRDLVQVLIERRKDEEEKKKQDEQKDSGGPGSGGDGGSPPGAPDKPKPDAPGNSPAPQGDQAGGGSPPPRPLPGPAPLPPRRPSELAKAPPPPAEPPPAASDKKEEPPPSAPPATPPSAPPSAQPPAQPPASAASDQLSVKPGRPAPPVRRAGPVAPPSLSDDPQAREQILRTVPDDPAAQLRAQFRSRYLGPPAPPAPPGSGN